jgi:hypothetical protein
MVDDDQEEELVYNIGHLFNKKTGSFTSFQ